MVQKQGVAVFCWNYMAACVIKYRLQGLLLHNSYSYED